MAALRSGMGGGPTRSTRQAITPDALGSLWPLVVPALTAELGRAGVDVEQAADAVQDLAVRALSDDAPRDPLAFTVWIQEAARSYADELRVHAEPLWLDLDLLTDRPAINDVPYDAGRRLAFHAVLRQMAAMSPASRRAVLDGMCLGAQDTLAEARTVAVRRYRARQVLARIADAFGLATALRLLRRSLPRLAAPTATVATAAVVLVTLAPIDPGGRSIAEAPPVALAGLLPAVGQQPQIMRARTTPPRTPLHRQGEVRDRASLTGVQPAPAVARTVIQGPAGTRLEHREKARQPDDPLVCLYGSPLPGRLCTPPLKNLELGL